jgi:hypothetical protein
LLPHAWVPPFIVVDSHRLPPPTVFARLLGGASGTALLRSNLPSERERPGSGRTVVFRGAAAELPAAIEESLRVNRDEHRLPLVQRAIEPALLGHMSNERSVSRRRSEWLVEGELFLRGPELRTIRASTPSPARALRADAPRALVDSLRSVAGWLTSRGRFRVEWLWDGERVWLVQADPAPAPVAAPPDRPRVAPTRLDSGIEGDRRFLGQKVSVWRLFSDLGLPVYPLLVISGSRWKDGQGREWLASFLARHQGDPVVVRTDATTSRGQPSLLLPTSPPLSDPARVSDFVAGSARAFRRKGASLDRFAFLVSPLLEGEVSALVHAEPGRRNTRIDALWGYPDGVMNLPHDSFLVRGKRVESEIRHKPARLEVGSRGWQVLPNGPDLDWAKTLSTSEALTIARWARKLATLRKESIVLMVFTRLGGRRGPSGCMPFWLGPGHEVPIDRRRAAVPADVPTVRTGAELRDLSARLARAKDGARGFLLSPDAEHMRDPVFLRAAGELAADRRLPVYFAGSILGHPYYLLNSTGAEVIRVELPSSRVGLRTPRLDLLALVRRPRGLERLAGVSLESVVGELRREHAQAVKGLHGEEALRSLEALLTRQADSLDASTGPPRNGGKAWIECLPRLQLDSPIAGIDPGGPGAIPLFMDESSS